MSSDPEKVLPTELPAETVTPNGGTQYDSGHAATSRIDMAPDAEKSALRGELEQDTLGVPRDRRMAPQELPDRPRQDSGSEGSSEDLDAHRLSSVGPLPIFSPSGVLAGGRGSRPSLHSHAPSAAASGLSMRPSIRSLPPLKRRETKLAQKDANPWQHLGITLGLPMVILFDLVVPCIIYYTWYDRRGNQWRRECAEQFPGPIQNCPLERPQFDEAILGSSVASFGVGELWILLARVWRLFYKREECAPLLSRSRWELDATSWVYAVAMICALIPFVVGASLTVPKLYLYGPSFIMGFLGILMVITTLTPFKLPIGINSHARGTLIRPFIYYAAEDFIAVDGLQDREFRVRYNERYESNKMFRRFFLNLTLWWMLGVCVYIGCVSAVIWTLPFHNAFGLSLGVLFSYIAIWAGTSYLWTKYEMRREHRAYEMEEVKDV